VDGRFMRSSWTAGSVRHFDREEYGTRWRIAAGRYIRRYA